MFVFVGDIFLTDSIPWDGKSPFFTTIWVICLELLPGILSKSKKMGKELVKIFQVFFYRGENSKNND